MSLSERIIFYLAIVALFVIFIYQTNNCCSEVYSKLIGLKYKQQLGVKGAGDGEFMFPHSLAVDHFGNIYVGDTGNKRVQKFSSNESFLTTWGSEGTNDGQFLSLHDVAVDPEGKFVYTVELKNHRVQKFYPNDTFVSKWGYNGTGGRDILRVSAPNSNQFKRYYISYR